MKKRIRSFFMALCICLTLLPMAALADGAEGAEGAVAQVGQTTYTDFDDAYYAALDADLPLVLLADYQDNTPLDVYYDMTIDLNGHKMDMALNVKDETLTLTNSSADAAGTVTKKVTVSSGNLKIAADTKALTINEVVGSGGYVGLTSGNVTVEKLTLSAGSLAVSNGATINDLTIGGGKVTFYYGKFGKITMTVSASTLVDLLMDGYAFFDQNNYGTVVDANKTTLSNVYVTKGHACSFTPKGDSYQCGCGRTASQEPVKYLNASGQMAECGTYTIVTDSDYDVFYWTSGWYVVSGNVTIRGKIHLAENSDVHLILKDGASLNATGINTSEGPDYGSVSLSIYAQSTGSIMGKLTLSGFTNASGTNGHGISILHGSSNTGSLTINGGDIDVTGGSIADPTDGEPVHGESYGIYVNGNININGGKVKAVGGAVATTAGNNNCSIGIKAYYGKITISAAAVTANGGNATDDSCGLSASQALTITNSTVTGKGGLAAGDSSGICAYSGMVVTDSTVSGTGQASGTRFGDGESTGIYVSGDLTVSGSTTSVTGTATTAAVTDPVNVGYSYYYGEYTDACYGVNVRGSVTVSGGAALSGAAGNVNITYIDYDEDTYDYYYYAQSYGVTVGDLLTVSGGSSVSGSSAGASITLNPAAGKTSVGEDCFAGAYSMGIYATLNVSGDTTTVNGTAGNAAVNTAGGTASAYSCGIYTTDYYEYDYGSYTVSKIADALTLTGGTVTVSSGAATVSGVTNSDNGYEENCALCVDSVKVWKWDDGYNYWVFDKWADGKVTVSGGTVKGKDSDSVQACVQGDLIVTGTGKVVLTKGSYVSGKKEGVTEADEAPSVIFPVVTPSTGNTVTNPDGSTTTTTTDQITGAVTETTKDTNGVTGTTVTDKNGNVTDVSANVPASAVKDGETVSLPIDDVKPENGTEIKVNVPSGGAAVEIPVENPTAGTVVVIVGKDGTETMIPGSKVTENGVTVTLTESAAVKVIDNSKAFSDVPANAYFADAVKWASARSITGGTSSSAATFGPSASCTRAQLVTFLYRAAVAEGVDTSVGESTNILSYTDALDIPEYAVEAFQWAVGAGIVQGADGKLMPNDNCTRAQIVTMLFRFAAVSGMDGVTLQELVGGYTDRADVPNYALDAFNWALAQGVVKGADGKLMPNAGCDRAQIVTMLYRLLG